ncbi:MAG: asparagine synthase-related protein [Pseudomonadota bacterium]
MTKSGLFALAALDGAALVPRDLAALDLDDPRAPFRLQGEGIAAKAVDREEAGRAANVVERADGFTLLLGHLDEAEDLAESLGLERGTPPAGLAAAAITRFGADAPMRMIGEWTLLDWHGPSRTLTLLMSEASRDPLYFAFDGNRVAASAEMNRLTRLDWVGRDFDPGGLLFHWSTARLRRYMTDETVFSNVRRLVPGSREVFRIGDRRTTRLPAPVPGAPFRGSAGEANEALEAVMRRIVGQHLSRHGRVASLLSGGLDSSLLAWLESAERRPDQPISFLTSVAPAGSGIPDESEDAKAAADHLGFPIRFITPEPDASLYIPASRMFAHSELPVASPRHYLYNALYQAAFDDQADVLFDGAYGELTITNPMPLKLPLWNPRRHVRAWRGWKADRAARREAPAFPFHVQLPQQVIESIPALVPHDWKAPYDPVQKLKGHELWGFRVAAVKNAMTPTSSPEARLRHVIPFRDRRLLNLMATMPASLMEQDGLTRAPARKMLANGRLPDRVRLRVWGKPFSPDFLVRAERQALATIERIDGFRTAGAGEWIDLDWLEKELRTLSQPGVATYDRVHSVQATAVAAAYMEWWAGQ